MRPRVFPAEDSSGEPRITRVFGDASMRPRVFPAEDPPNPFPCVVRTAPLQ